MNYFKRIKSTSIAILLLGLGLMTSEVSAEEHPGKVLFDDNNCMQCHAGLGFKISPNPKMTVTDKASLAKTVTLCSNNLHLGLFDDEIGHIADYLNQKYYKFDH